VSIPLFSKYIDGYIPYHTGRIAPQFLTNGGFPVTMPQGMVSFIWWRVRAWAFDVIYSGSRNETGTTPGGNSYTYTESYSGTGSTTMNISVPADLASNSGVFISPEYSIQQGDEIDLDFSVTSKLFSKAVNGIQYSYEWVGTPPPDAPPLPTNYTGPDRGVRVTIMTPDLSANYGTPAINNGSFAPLIQINLFELGISYETGSSNVVTGNFALRDSTPSTLGNIRIFSANYPVKLNGNLAFASIWPQP